MPRRDDIETILLIGSGPIVIGQASEFDYSGTQACRILKEEGYTVILANSNPATIMTDPEFADRTYVEPLDVDVLTAIIERERPDALLPTLGGTTYKLPFGHHGGNHPVQHLASGHVEVTSQNHNFCVDADSLGDTVEVTHVNLNDNTNEGMWVKGEAAFSVQYHPEAGPGPHDAAYLFEDFKKLMDGEQ